MQTVEGWLIEGWSEPTWEDWENLVLIKKTRRTKKALVTAVWRGRERVAMEKDSVKASFWLSRNGKIGTRPFKFFIQCVTWRKTRRCLLAVNKNWYKFFWYGFMDMDLLHGLRVVLAVMPCWRLNFGVNSHPSIWNLLTTSKQNYPSLYMDLWCQLLAQFPFWFSHTNLSLIFFFFFLI